MRNTNKRLIAAGAAMLLAALPGASPASAAPDDQPWPSTVTPYVVGGEDATKAYPGMASLRITRDGDPQFHVCGAILVHPFAVVVNAHCVTLANGAPKDASLFTLRIGSVDRLAGGLVRRVAQVLPHERWDWGAGADAVADIAVLRLNAPVWLRPFPIGATARGAVRLLGWGSTKASGEGPLPTVLQQLDTGIVPAERCAAGGITPGEVCVDNPGGVSGACYGDSGGPALRRLTPRRWVAVGGASREITGVCGGGPTIYTDLTHYREWIYRTIVTGIVPHRAARAAVTTTSAATRAFQQAGLM